MNLRQADTIWRVAAGAFHVAPPQQTSPSSEFTWTSSTGPQVLERPASGLQYKSLVSPWEQVPNGEILCAEARGSGFPHWETPAVELVYNPRKNIENGGVTSYVTPPTKKIIKNKNPKKKYRGRGKFNRKNSVFTVLLTNQRGYTSKETCLKNS